MTLNRPLLVAMALTGLAGSTGLAQWPPELIAGRARARAGAGWPRSSPWRFDRSD